MFMIKPWDFVGDKTMEIAGDKARRGLDNFMKAFKNYEVEHVVADIKVGGKIPELKIALQIKMKKGKEEDK